jgi:hypothetical protein
LKFRLLSSLLRGLFFYCYSSSNKNLKESAKIRWPHIPSHYRQARNYGINPHAIS